MKKGAFDPNDTLYLIDGTSFAYRAFFAIRGLRNSEGLATGAIFGFVNTLNKILKDFDPRYLGVCFDVSRKTFRQEKFKEYKITRPEVPDELKPQISWIKDIIRALNLPIAELKGYEADDIIATLARKAKEAKFRCVVFSMDKDIMQIVEDESIMLYNPNKDILFDEERVAQALGVYPKNVPDLLGLCGDPVDNIPGVKGIGSKTAVSLIQNFGSLEKILENIGDISKDSLKRMLSESKDIASLSKDLSLLDKSVPIDAEIEDLKVGQPDHIRLYEIFRQLEFKSLTKAFAPAASLSRHYPVKDCDEGVLREITRGKELIFYCSDQSIFLLHRTSIYKAGPAQLKSMLEDPAIDKVSFDVKDSILALNRYGIRLTPPYFDIMIASFLLNSHIPDTSLESVVWQHLGVARDTIDEVEKVTFIGKLYKDLEKKLESSSLDKLFSDIEIPLIEVLAWMEGSAVSIDVDFLQKYLSSLKEKQASLEKDIFRLADAEFNLNSPKQLAQILFARLKLPVIKRTKTGFSTNEEVLNRLKDKHPIVDKILGFRKLAKLLSTYIEPFIEQAQQNQGRIVPKFSQVSTSTGRLVSFSPNLQNIPIKEAQGRAIRGGFVPSFKQGLILSADYSQIELRVLAHISGDEHLIEAFKTDKDIHRFTASLVFSKKEEDVSLKERDFAKRINFGIVYGMSSFGLSKDLSISLQEAEDFIAGYFLRYPGVKRYIDQTQESAKKNGFVSTLMGRRRILENLDSPNRALQEYSLRQAINAPIQGTAADIIKLAMIKVFKEFKQKKLASRLIIQIHDELVFDVANDELETVAETIKRIMEKAAELKVPLKVNIQWGKTWLEATK